MSLLVASASGSNGNGLGSLLAFGGDGSFLGPFSKDNRITDPRGLAVKRDEGVLFLNSGSDRVLALDSRGTVVRGTGRIAALNPGGGIFGPNGRYYVGSRSERTIIVFRSELDDSGELFLPPAIVPFPRGFAFGMDGRFYLASGIGPDGMGNNAIVTFDAGDRTKPVELVKDPELSPLDMTIAPNGNIVVSSEYPFGAPDAITTIREYDAMNGRLVRVLRPKALAEFRKPRGLRFGTEGNLYCVARDEVVAFDFRTGACLGVIVRMARLHGQALVFFP